MTLQTLSYDTPRHAKPTAWLHYVALACGLIPLVVGSGAFVLYLILREGALAGVGFLTILGGVCLAFIGITCAGVSLFQARRAAPDEAARARRRALIALAIILANFPIAFGMARVGLRLMSQLEINVQNRDVVAVDQFHITRNDDVHDFGTIPAGGMKSVTVSEDDLSDDVTITFTRAGVEHQQTLGLFFHREVGSREINLTIRNGEVTDEDLTDAEAPTTLPQ